MEFLSRLVCDRRALERNLQFVYLASSGIREEFAVCLLGIVGHLHCIRGEFALVWSSAQLTLTSPLERDSKEEEFVSSVIFFRDVKY